MLFTSYVFLFLFLPATLMLSFLVGKWRGTEAVIFTLIIASLVFYGYFKPEYLLILLFSILFNYALSKKIINEAKQSIKKIALTFGIIVNVGLLAYFKYAGFLTDNVNQVFQTNLSLGHVILPLAISFFTFQQIAYLVESYRGEVEKTHFSHYVLFVTFFPQLIAGPIVHHREMFPQFKDKQSFKISFETLSVGTTIFMIGLFKKVVLADNFAPIADQAFLASEEGKAIDFYYAWAGVCAYSFQIYFDFSGYSDMAIGLARMFGITLPDNFLSPYKSKNIIEFWRNWHITLSRFLRNYIYIPLGGNKKSEVRQAYNILITMLIGGLWHGASWLFVLWGGLHGLCIILNHFWQKHINIKLPFSFVFTFIMVSLLWIFFRAETLNGASNLISSLFTLPGSFEWSNDLGWVFIGLFVIWLCPNTKEIASWIFNTQNKAIHKGGVLSIGLGIMTALLFWVNIFFIFYHLKIPEYKPEFLYFQF